MEDNELYLHICNSGYTFKVDTELSEFHLKEENKEVYEPFVEITGFAFSQQMAGIKFDTTIKTIRTIGEFFIKQADRLEELKKTKNIQPSCIIAGHISDGGSDVTSLDDYDDDIDSCIEKGE